MQGRDRRDSQRVRSNAKPAYATEAILRAKTVLFGNVKAFEYMPHPSGLDLIP